MAKTLADLQYGDGVKIGTLYDEKIQWYVADKNHSGHPSNSVDLIAKGIVKMAPLDAIEFSNAYINCRTCGYARWRYSNLRKFLNSDAAKGKWWSATWSPDVAPSSGFVDYDPYYDDAGFLNAWAAKEKGMLLSVTHKTSIYRGDGTYENVADKVYLPTEWEVGIAHSEASYPKYGTKFKLFENTTYLTAKLTAGAASRAEVQLDIAQSWIPTKGGTHAWWVAGSASIYNPARAARIQTDGSGGDDVACSSQGVRPMICLSQDTIISDTPDSDGDYIVFIGTAPSAPRSIEVSEDVRGGSTATVSWGASSNLENYPLRSYVLEMSADGETYEEVYRGTGRTAIVDIEYGTETVQFRVYCINSYGVESTYATSEEVTVFNNHPPEITASTTALGTFTETPPEWTYTVSDEDNETNTVQEFLDGVLYHTKTPTLDEEQTYTFTGTEWRKILNGTHTMKIVTTDAKNETDTKTVTFVKNVTTIEFTKVLVVASTDMPTEGILFIDGSFPQGCDLTIEICNNGYDDEPTWEDVTEYAIDEELFEFTNDTKEAANWGVLVRVTLSRGTATDDCYIEQVIGNFN